MIPQGFKQRNMVLAIFKSGGVLPTLELETCTGFIHQQDNEPKTDQRRQTVLTVMDFPPQSSDRHTNENVWGPLNSDKVRHSVASKQALFLKWSVIRFDSACCH